MGDHRVRRPFGEVWVAERRTNGKFWLGFGFLTLLAAFVVVGMWDGVGSVVVSGLLTLAAVGKAAWGLNQLLS